MSVVSLAELGTGICACSSTVWPAVSCTSQLDVPGVAHTENTGE
jgi:hypothetical protein